MILVFGKTGQLAMELQLFENLVALDRDQTDLTNPKSCVRTIFNRCPEAVINAAAYTNVDQAEEDEVNATIINGDAPTAMAEACNKLDIPFIHISSDYVFDGTGNLPWKVQDITVPQNAYGRSKLAGEIGIRASGATHAIIRTSWLISSHGKNFVKTMLCLSKTKNKLKIVADQIGGPTYARDLAAICMQIIKELKLDPKKSGTYHYSGKPDVSWAEFASEIFSQADINTDIKPIYTSNYPTIAKRPLNSRLDYNKIRQVFGITQPKWRESLKHILRELKVKS